MKKKLIALVLAAAICLAVVPAALAAGHCGGPGGAGPGGGKPAKPKPARGKPFACKGAVVSVDATADTLLVTVKQGSPDMRPYVGQQESFTLGAHAVLFIRTVNADGSVVLTPATIDQVTAAVKAAISGGLKGNASAPLFTAQRVVVTLPATPTPAPTASDSPSPTPSGSPSPAV